MATTGSDYHVVHRWPHIPHGELLGQVSGVGVDSHGNVLVFRRADRGLPAATVSVESIGEPTVWLFEGQTGRLLERWGANQFAMPHGLTVDQDDNLWLTAVWLHQVFKYSHDGVSLLTLGTRGVPGSDAGHFDGPTDVAIGADGSVYVSDGYGNNRVVQFSSEGRYIREWGRKGNGPGEFNLPHSIAVDSVGRLYVADRGNARVQVFDSAGRFLREWRDSTLGRPWAVRVASDGLVYLVDGGDQHPPERARIHMVTLDGKVVASFGVFGTTMVSSSGLTASQSHQVERCMWATCSSDGASRSSFGEIVSWPPRINSKEGEPLTTPVHHSAALAGSIRLRAGEEVTGVAPAPSLQGRCSSCWLRS